MEEDFNCFGKWEKKKKIKEKKTTSTFRQIEDNINFLDK